MKPLGYARVYLNDIVGECDAHGLGLREQGILVRLLRAQHMAGPLPADQGKLRRLAGDEARPDEVKRVADLFFPLTKDRKSRVNVQHAEENAAARHAYEEARRKGKMGAAKTWGRDGSANGPANSSANGPGYGNHNHNQNLHHHRQLTESIPGRNGEEDNDDVPF